MHDVCFQSKPLKNVDSLIRDSRMKVDWVKCKSHLVYLTSEHCFLAEKNVITLSSRVEIISDDVLSLF